MSASSATGARAVGVTKAAGEPAGARMTWMSGSLPSGHWTLADLPAVARVSLVLVVAMFVGVPTCLVTSTTEFPEPRATPPFLHLTGALATPTGGIGVPVTKVVVLDPKKPDLPVAFSADVQSEDRGRSLLARVYIDYGSTSAGARNPFGGGDQLPPGTFDQVRRIAAYASTSFIADSMAKPGCHTATLVVTHKWDNLNDVPERQDDTAIAVWFVLVGDGTTPMATCPGVPAPSAGDGGPDAKGD
jgi:hypothetical protein